MAEELLVKESLSAEEITAGEVLLKRLDGAGMDVLASYWVFSPTVGEWHVEFVTPLIESEGPVEFYNKVGELLLYPKKIDCLTLNSIMGLGPNYSYYELLQESIRPEKDLFRVRLSRLVVGNEVVDLYIYRFPAKKNTNGSR
jgi:hypothetical protein